MRIPGILFIFISAHILTGCAISGLKWEKWDRIKESTSSTNFFHIEDTCCIKLQHQRNGHPLNAHFPGWLPRTNGADKVKGAGADAPAAACAICWLLLATMTNPGGGGEKTNSKWWNVSLLVDAWPKASDRCYSFIDRSDSGRKIFRLFRGFEWIRAVFAADYV